MQKEHISSLQLFCLTISFNLGTAIILTPAIRYGERDAWLGNTIATGLGMIISLMLYLLISKFPGKNLGEILTALLGPLLGKVILSGFILYAILLGAFVLNNIESLFSTVIIPETPRWVFALTMSLATGFVVAKGLEVAARCCHVVTPLVVLAFSFMVLAAAPQLNFNYLRPFFAAGFVNISKVVIIITAFPYGEMILLSFLAPQVQDTKKILPALLSGTALSGFFLILRPVYAIGIFGAHEAAQLNFPVYFVARSIVLGEFVERVEILLVFAWFFTTFIKLAVCMLASLWGLAYLFNLKDIKGLVYPFSLFLFPLGLRAYADHTEVEPLVASVWPLLTLPQVFVLLPFLLLLSRLKPGKKKREQLKKRQKFLRIQKKPG
ncbi:MAG: spore germination protein [Peptococcaceae bacterium]|jgi:spore germination protein KB|uniref:GerAB/ArcD/ProY family transporter n=1 Tax=Thermanaerosceptrum fracticalcis TaxID=1712410 RepID=A0A7G6E7R4_THEFR|nr:endospore germination permease [Thermanaerosceptrum fracticalcis]MBZ4654305.1 spore germination protein [Peptococcaceae bacterium]QNB48118.1 GerAB/ArcD/ProY family transporter [Thermanaerosceptrum fracticalcis]